MCCRSRKTCVRSEYTTLYKQWHNVYVVTGYCSVSDDGNNRSGFHPTTFLYLNLKAGIHTRKSVFILGENGLAICENSIYGCCWDRKTAKEDERGSNCPGMSRDKYSSATIHIAVRPKLLRQSREHTDC